MLDSDRHSPSKSQTSQMSFFSKVKGFAKVHQLTSDDNEMPSAPMMKELADLTLESAEESQSIMDNLLDRLEKDSPFTRTKALRLIKFLCMRGRADFQTDLQRKNEAVRACQSTVFLFISIVIYIYLACRVKKKRKRWRKVS